MLRWLGWLTLNLNGKFFLPFDTNDGMMKRLNLPLRWIRQMAQIRFWREADRAMLSTGCPGSGKVMALYLPTQPSLSSVYRIKHKHVFAKYNRREAEFQIRPLQKSNHYHIKWKGFFVFQFEDILLSGWGELNQGTRNIVQDNVSSENRAYSFDRLANFIMAIRVFHG